jgi:ribosomal-protein-serine acetyltransferase
MANFSLSLDDVAELRILEPRLAQEWFDVIDENRPHMREWMNWLDDFKTVEDSRNFILASLSQFSTSTGIKAAIMVNGKIVGSIAYQEIDWTNSIAILGAWISESYEGKGLATRATVAFINYAFDELKLNRVEIRSAFYNERSRAVPKRLGFTEEGVLRQSMWLYDHFVDEVVYSMLAYEWQTKKSQPQLKLVR